MRLRRRQFQQLAAGALALPAVSRAGAQTYPAQPVRLMVGFAAGQAIDILARLIAQSLGEQFSQQFIVENKPGAGGNIVAEQVARAAAGRLYAAGDRRQQPDQHHALRQARFDLLRDFAPVAGIYRVFQVMVVNPTFPAKTLPEFIAYAKANPGQDQLRLGRHRLGGACQRRAVQDDGRHRHAARALSRRAAGARRPDERPGAGHVRQPAVIDRAHPGRPPARARRLDAGALELLPGRADDRRIPGGFETNAFAGLGAPSGTPRDIIDKLNKAVTAALADPKIKARILDLGGVPMPMAPAEFGSFLAEETEKWAKVIRAADIKPG